MNKNSFIKISAAVFIFLAIGISLFPPFEFGNEKLRTLSERKLNPKIVDKLPIKEYDFIFSSNKKYFALSSYDFIKQFYSRDTAKYYENLWSDKLFKFIGESVDTFLTASRFIYQRWTENDWIKNNKGRIKRHRYDFSPLNDEIGIEKKKKEKTTFDFISIFEGQYTYWIDDSRIIRFNRDETNRDAVNFIDVKDKYESAPQLWDYKYEYKIDSIKKYYEYSITQPEYYLLKREILFAELVIEYILAFFVSLIIGFIIPKIGSTKHQL